MRKMLHPAFSLLAPARVAERTSLCAALLSTTACGTRALSKETTEAGFSQDASFDSHAEPDADSGSACATDEDCNFASDPEIRGTCFGGFCFCDRSRGFYVQSNGKCGLIPPISCAQQRGECHADAARCPVGTLDGDPYWTSQMCGEPGTFRCCIPETSCGGTKDFICCGASGEAQSPICVYQWRACPPNTSVKPGPSCD